MTTETDTLAAECDAYGLPHSLPTLLRHIRGNHTAIVDAKDFSIRALTEQRNELYDALEGLMTRLGDVAGIDSTNPAEAEALRVLVGLKRARQLTAQRS